MNFFKIDCAYINLNLVNIIGIGIQIIETRKVYTKIIKK